MTCIFITTNCNILPNIFQLDVTVKTRQIYIESVNNFGKDLWLIDCSLYFLFGFFWYWRKSLNTLISFSL